ncbi:hypothetical protein [Terriglobus aquaticus]|uniref:Uncharacterized protein n=1 Tax=Terriglobus aquaticus TaxID=940139 RepID=A0ABW9KFD3_9BACT|nr:hypothetical protein [Terriglobus aquaticus]
MLLFLVILFLLLHRRRWYGYGYYPYWGYPQYRGYGPYGPSYNGYVWNGYAWQPQYGPAYYRGGYGYCRRAYWW